MDHKEINDYYVQGISYDEWDRIAEDKRFYHIMNYWKDVDKIDGEIGCIPEEQTRYVVIK